MGFRTASGYEVKIKKEFMGAEGARMRKRAILFNLFFPHSRRQIFIHPKRMVSRSARRPRNASRGGVVGEPLRFPTKLKKNLWAPTSVKVVGVLFHFDWRQWIEFVVGYWVAQKN